MKRLPFSNIRNFVLGCCLVLLSGGIGYRIGQKDPVALRQNNSTRSAPQNTQTPSNVRADFSLFWDVWGRMFRYFYDAKNLDPQKMLYGAISGMVAAGDDPYTSFLPPQENKEFKEDIGGSFQGIGAQLGLKDSRVIIVAPLKGSPAEKMGVRPSDIILEVNGEETYGWSVDQAVGKIRGKKGTTVTLSVLHDTDTKPTDITIVRDEIIIPSVDSWIKPISQISELSGLQLTIPVSKTVGYIALSRFGDRTQDEWDSAVSEIASAYKMGKIPGLVFDLRNNPGGYLDMAVSIASEFIKNGTVVTQQTSDGTKDPYSVNRVGKLTDIPLVVLINKGSASAAEIVAGALKDHKRATIVGETSFGKGSVQTPQELSGGASLHVTTAEWLTPSGSWIHKKGIKPDVEVKMEDYEATKDAQLEKAIELLLQ